MNAFPEFTDEELASIERSRADMFAGRVLPWRAVYLPRPIVWLLFRIAPYLPLGRRLRKMVRASEEKHDDMG